MRDNVRVTLAVDTSTPVRSLGRYRELILAIYQAPASEQETNSIEWKGEVDLAEKRWQAEMGRQLLGMANRDPDVASRVLGGCGYILLGVSPGDLPGTQVHDAAKIDSWISAYTGQLPHAPEWSPTFVEVHGKHILVLTVEPPRHGHPAWPCRKEYSPDPRTSRPDTGPSLREGAIYVRHKASTREATAADIEMLSRRAASGVQRRIGGVSLLLAPGSRAVAPDLRPESVLAWADREREALKPPPQPPPTPEPADSGQTINIDDLPKDHPLRMTAEAVASMSGAIQAAMRAGALGAQAMGWEDDRRTPEEYAAQVDGYIAKASEALPGVLISRSRARGLGRIAFSVRNSTENPIHGLQVEVRIPAEGVIALNKDEIPAEKLPDPPVMLGKLVRSRFDYLGGVPFPALTSPRYDLLTPGLQSFRRVRIDNSHSVLLTFDPVDLYPEETAELEEVWLFAHPALAGTTVTAEWSARSRDASGVLRETIDIEVDTRVLSIDQLLADSDEAAPSDEMD